MRQKPSGGRSAKATPCLLPQIGCAILLVLVAGWAWLLLGEVRRRSSATAAASCLAAVFRDPVTGREQGIGPVRVQPDGAITCRSGILHRLSR